jgi:hypothetical protein
MATQESSCCICVFAAISVCNGAIRKKYCPYVVDGRSLENYPKTEGSS